MRGFLIIGEGPTRRGVCVEDEELDVGDGDVDEDDGLNDRVDISVNVNITIETGGVELELTALAQSLNFHLTMDPIEN